MTEKLYLQIDQASCRGPLTIHGVGIREAMPPGMLDRPRGWNAHLLMLFHTPARVGFEDSTESVSSGSAVLWPPQRRHYFGNPNSAWNHSWLILGGAPAAALFAPTGIPELIPFPVKSHEILPLLRMIYAELSQGTTADGVVLHGICTLLARYLERSATGTRVASESESRLSEVRRFIETHLEEPMTLEQLAHQAHLSTSHFSALFRETFGVPPLRYVEEQRMQAAAARLADPARSITEIAAEVGFEDPLYFSKRFRGRYGISPRGFRRDL